MVLALVLETILVSGPASAFNEELWAEQMNAGAFSRATSRYAEAQAHLAGAQHEIQGNSALETEALEFTLDELGKLAEKQGKIGEAENFFRKSFALDAKNKPSDDYPDTLIGFYKRTGRASYASKLEAQYKQAPVPKELTDYVNKVQPLIKNLWFPTSGHSSSEVTCVWAMRDNGSISLAHIVRSSGDAVVDQQACNAVKKASPLPLLPKCAKTPINIEFTFEYKGK